MTTQPAHGGMRPANMPKPDITEKGAPKDGAPQELDRRLFMQLRAFGSCRDAAALATELDKAAFQSVLYADLADNQGVGLLTFSEDENHFVTGLRDLLNNEPFASLTPKPEYTMIGRTYALGHEADLEDWLIHKPRKRVLDPAWPWAIWYPLRRTGEFSRLPKEKQMPVLREHGIIGRSFGEAGLGLDVRLACHGIDKNDNDFVIGLLGKRLHPLSALVERMRKTVQTSSYIEKMGPFFVGRAIRQSA